MSHWIKILAVSLMAAFLTIVGAVAEEIKKLPIVERPENHVWDYDNFFRNDPQLLREVSKMLVDLEEESGQALYIVTHSFVLGEAPQSVAKRCHEKWLGEESDGLVVVLSFNDSTSGVVGRSNKLYDGHFIEKGMMPTVSYSNLISIMTDTIQKIKYVEKQGDRVQIFVSRMSQQLKERIEISKKETESKRNYQFMGWMALLVLGCGGLLALLSKLSTSVDRRVSSRVYEFPEFTVPERLLAANGGGKLSVLDFESPPLSSDA